MTDLDQFLPAIVIGEPEAFGLWMAGAEPLVRETLRSYAALVDTEAVIQEALLRVWQGAPRFVPDGKPNGLLRLSVRISRNLVMSEMRRLRKEPVELIALEQASASSESPQIPKSPDPLLRRLIEKCRLQLPAKPALALAQRLGSAGTAPDSILAARVGMTANTFLQNFTRARRFLAECLKSHGVDLEDELP